MSWKIVPPRPGGHLFFRFDLEQEPPCWCADLGGEWDPDTW